ncbi:MAG: cell division protein ZapA [Tissierellia bacterium]|nr:cell division protein ZapA [Tissierellia bacterium]
MSDKNRYEVQIGESSYIIRSSRTKQETDEIVNYVNEEIEKAEKSIRYKNPAMSATLACLNIADSAFTSRENYLNLKRDCEIPMRDYEPLRVRYENIVEKHKDSDAVIESLNVKILDLKTQLESMTDEKEKFRLELNKRMRDFEKSNQEIESLRDKLLEQEKETLRAYRQLQEALRRSE